MQPVYYEEKMEKTLTVTIKVEKDKPTRIEFLEPESGDVDAITVDEEKSRELTSILIGEEILSWVSIIQDEMEDDLITEMEEYLKEYELLGVELTEEDVVNVANKIKSGMSKDAAIREVLSGIREILDEGLDE